MSSCFVKEHRSLEKFKIEVLAKTTRQISPFLWMQNTMSKFQDLVLLLKDLYVPILSSISLFTRFIEFSAVSLQRTWNDISCFQWKHIYRLLAFKNPRLVGGSLNNIDIYYRNIPDIGPERIGGSVDAKFKSFFSIESL